MNSEQGPEKTLMRSHEAEAYAKANNLEVRFPKPNELFLDLDSAIHLDTFFRNFDLAKAVFGLDITYVSARSRRKRDGSHIVVTLPRDITNIERLLWQAILGSDLRREAHSYRNMLRGDERPTLFFEKSESFMSGVSPSHITTEESAESSATPSGETHSLE